jgi:hypothetical protein
VIEILSTEAVQLEFYHPVGCARAFLSATKYPSAILMIQGRKEIHLIETEPPSRITVTSTRRRSASLFRLQSDIAACRRCSSVSPWRQFDPDVYGTYCTGYLLVGEAPGYKSWEQRRRFTGPAGMLIRRALREVAHRSIES